jgi:hypothetical protein
VTLSPRLGIECVAQGGNRLVNRVAHAIDGAERAMGVEPAPRRERQGFAECVAFSGVEI